MVVSIGKTRSNAVEIIERSSSQSKHTKKQRKRPKGLKERRRHRKDDKRLRGVYDTQESRQNADKVLYPST
jgi:hypothetical protein